MSRNYTAIPTITIEQLKRIVYYDNEKGLLWKVNRGLARAGTKVGGKSRGQIRLNGVRVYSSHVVWFFHHGWWPSSRRLWVDHIDGNIENELIENIRCATPSENNANRGERMNKVLKKGVSLQNGKFRAGIQFEDQRIFLGSYNTEEEAAAAYEGASRILHGEFSVFSRT